MIWVKRKGGREGGANHPIFTEATEMQERNNINGAAGQTTLEPASLVSLLDRLENGGAVLKAEPELIHKLREFEAAAEALALLGQSRIASNLNQLAYHTNIGTLMVFEAEKALIAEAYRSLSVAGR